ncbi:MAG: nucleoside hydrolase [Candidatus Schekmanbacteria bacterium]|nr:nucleoside hydrolase [Candidatus Schekmanbacteria bacterium]
MSENPIIIDTDGGIDDALAITVARNYLQAEIKAVTTVGGNIPLKQASSNICLLLSFISPKSGSTIPVYEGSAKPLEGGAYHHAYEYHGKDGMGGLSSKLKKDVGSTLHEISKGKAWDKIAEICAAEKGKVKIIAIGPLTNIAKAILDHPKEMKKTAEIIVMGGAFHSPGNITPAAEFNIYSDPAAAEIVFASKIPLKLIGLNITERAYLSQWEVEKKFSGRTDRKCIFLKELMMCHITLHEKAEKFSGLFLHDPVAVIAGFKSDLFQWTTREVNVETGKGVARGMTVIDTRRKSKEQGKTQVAFEADILRIKEMILGAL